MQYTPSPLQKQLCLLSTGHSLPFGTVKDKTVSIPCASHQHLYHMSLVPAWPVFACRQPQHVAPSPVATIAPCFSELPFQHPAPTSHCGGQVWTWLSGSDSWPSLQLYSPKASLLGSQPLHPALGTQSSYVSLSRWAPDSRTLPVYLIGSCSRDRWTGSNDKEAFPTPGHQPTLPR